jgi:GAF domain-containing protein
MSRNLGGIRDTSYAAYIMVVALAGLLLGWRMALVVAVLSIVVGWGLADSEVNQVLPTESDSPYEVLVGYAALFFIMAGLISASNLGFRRLLSRVREHEHELRARNWDLQQMRETLEVRVAERTEDLRRRSNYLQAAAQVAYSAGQLLDADRLVDETVDLIREAFELYYVGFFEIDSTGEWALLRAGTGEAGEKMLARGHKIKVGEGMVGWTIEHGESRFAQHAEEDRIRILAPELPETRAEAALPLRARDRVLGALTIQSREPDFFDEATVTVLQTMADLLAIALNNAELYEESQQAVAAVRRAYGDVASDAWAEIVRTRGTWGYRYRDGAVQPSNGNWSSATSKALQGNELIQDLGDQASAVAIPLRVGGQVIGAISYQRPVEDGEWAEEDVTLLGALTDQLSQALDSARLLQETRQQAAREQRLNDISVSVSNSVDIEGMLRAAIQELGQLPGVLEASVHLDVPQSVASGERMED